MELFDSHCHLDDEKFDQDREEIISHIFSSGVTKLISAGYSLEGSKKAIELTSKYPQIYTVSGISPNDILENVEKIEEQINEIEKYAKNEKVVGIGEIGLDYYWNKENKDLQQFAFIKQIELANSLNLPIVIHTRDAVADTIEILKKHPVNKKGVFHCCPLNPELIKEALKLGFYISFAGPITFKNSKNADEVINLVPDDRILIETDSPYLSPEPNRGKRNDSSNVKYIAQKIANVKGYAVEKVAKMTYDNACRIFEIK
ncbi:MAG: TatD family hydrolase [Clostridia bacterium]|nr:TatD family hydrolase [Clostridia bacterium]